MRHCVLGRIAPLVPSRRLRERDDDEEQWRTAPAAATRTNRSAPRAEPELQTRVRSAHSEDIAAREWLICQLRWDAKLAALHTRAGIPTYRWMWECRALHWTAF